MGLERASWVATITGLVVSVLALVAAWPGARNFGGGSGGGESNSSGKYRISMTNAKNVQIGDRNAMNVKETPDGW
ncbi:hypothetical protein GCM10022419_010810 [Nonomuraea rosea]|uniref:SH3 domain-containing protein n=1 Tax=Nonomuraea rosea TaxID=638574 RepID=A0ABP6VG49_9ACTN